MNKIILFVIILSILSCAPDVVPYTGNAGDGESRAFERKAVHCLRDFLTGEDAGGYWQQVGTTPQNISNLLVGDNPCIEWSNKSCGQYPLRYIVGDACCRDTAYITLTKCCMSGGSTCN